QPAAQWVYPRANLVIGQSGFNSKISDPTQTTMSYPYGIAFAGTNGLLVSDPVHNRVLLFRGKHTELTSGQAAGKVFGQADFRSFQGGTGDDRMFSPRHISTDTDDRLYVADERNNRVLIFDRATDTATTRASVVIGGLNQPRGIFVSQITGEFWVAEGAANRILRYPKFDDLAAQQLQPNFQIATNFCIAITQDAFGDVVTAESTNRVSLYYPSLKRIVNGAAPEYTQGKALAPGVIATLTSQGNGNRFAESAISASSVPLPRELGDIQVLVNQNPAPLYYVSPEQINFQITNEAPTSGQVELQIVRKSTGQIYAVGQADMTLASPSLFTLNGAGNGPLVAFNEDGTLNSATNQIARGKVVSVYGTGQGVIASGPKDGEAPSGPVATDQLPRVFIGTRFIDDADILYSGLVPGSVGVWQINFKVPDFVVPANAVQVFVQLRSVPSVLPGQVTTIAVKQN
ncbi:MAG: hypothetical protein ABIZ80_14490, partial [Bryobacteraceae bacterium]